MYKTVKKKKPSSILSDEIFFSKTENCTNATNNCAQIMILFTNPSARAGYDTRSIFKRSLTGLNSEFSFS